MRWACGDVLVDVGDSAGLGLLADARTAVDRCSDPGIVVRYLDRIESRHAVAATVTEAPGIVEQLTERETAVLRYLPTALSQREIASALFVSTNTVKTHCTAIYRKLAVDNRPGRWHGRRGGRQPRRADRRDRCGAPRRQRRRHRVGADRYVQLAHLRSGSVPVAVGEQVGAGPMIGRCGNSGHSLEPHLHMQVQDTPSSNNHHHRGDGGSLPLRFGDATHIRDGVETTDQTSLFRRNDRRSEP